MTSDYGDGSFFGGDSGGGDTGGGGSSFFDNAGSAVPRGTLKTLDGYVYQWDGTRWYNTGVRDPKATSGGGLTFEQQQALRSTPSYSVSQSYSDPSSIQLGRDQLNEAIRKSLADDAKDAETMRFNRDKFRVETERGDKQLALQTQQLMETIQNRIDNRALAREQMQATAANIDRQIAATAAEGQANRAQRTYEAQLADKLSRDKAIAEYSRNPGDIGAVSAFLQRNGQSNISTALGQGETAVTDRSLEPLQNLLSPPPSGPSGGGAAGPLTSAMAGAQPPQRKLNPYEANPNMGKGSAQIIDSQGNLWDYVPGQSERQIIGHTTPGSAYMTGDPNAPGGSGTVTRTGMDRTAANYNMDASGVPDWVNRFEDGGAVVPHGVLNGLMAIVRKLGLEPKAVAGERGQANGETVYAPPDASVVVMPDKGAGMPHMQDGGVTTGWWNPPQQTGEFTYSGGASGPVAPVPAGSVTGTAPAVTGASPGSVTGPTASLLNPLLQQARDFQQRTGQTALERSGFGAAPTPISLADPGTSPWLRQLGASTTAAIKGIPPEVFLNELMRLIPRGMQFGMPGRTR